MSEQKNIKQQRNDDAAIGSVNDIPWVRASDDPAGIVVDEVHAVHGAADGANRGLDECPILGREH